MQDTKWALRSRSMIGILVMIGAAIAKKNGWDWWGLLEPHLLELLNEIAFWIGTYWAGKGTLLRSSKLTLLPRLKPPPDAPAADPKALLLAALEQIAAEKPNLKGDTQL